VNNAHSPNTLASRIASQIEESIATKQRVLEAHVPVLVRMAQVLVDALRNGKRVFFFGNGGSAADSQHIAAELVGRFMRERAALPAMALSTDTSILTALANDYDYDIVFARQIEAFGQPGDVAVGISTSGNSANVLAGIRAARERGMTTLALTGETGGKLQGMVDVCFCAPSRITSHIQETHITVSHSLCELVERELFEVDEQADGRAA
jgi:D-sedoheptulose 7-phosphate isomerase